MITIQIKIIPVKIIDNCILRVVSRSKYQFCYSNYYFYSFCIKRKRNFWVFL